MGGRGSLSFSRKQSEIKRKQHLENREKQRYQAFANRLQRWDDDMKKEGVSRDVRERLIGMYNIDVARKGHAPKVTLSNEKEAYYDPLKKKIVLNKDSKTWHGNVDTAEHEMGHWLDDHTRFRGNLSVSQKADNARGLSDATKKDWSNIQKRMRGMMGTMKVSNYGYYTATAHRLFKRQAQTLTERKIINSYADVIGSMSNGAYGGGHKKKYYKSDMTKVEIFTHTLSAIRRKDLNFKLEFPNTWDYVEKITKGLYK